MEHEAFGQLDEHAVAKEQRDDLLRGNFVDGKRSKYFLHCGRLEPGGCKRALDGLLRLRLLVLHDNAPSGQADGFAGNFDLLPTSEIVE